MASLCHCHLFQTSLLPSPTTYPFTLYVKTRNIHPRRRFHSLKKPLKISFALSESDSSSDSLGPSPQILLQQLADSFTLPPDYFAKLPSDLRLDLNDAAFDLSNGPVIDQCGQDLGQTLLNLSRAWELADTPYSCTLVSKLPSLENTLTDSQKSALGRRLVSAARRFQGMGQYGQGELQKAPNISESASLDSLDSLFNDEKGEEINQRATSNPPKEEPIYINESDGNKRSSLLEMNFSLNEVEFALDRLGEEAPVYELVDFITAAQMAEIYEEKNEVQDYHPETLFSTMDRTLRLLEMGFSEQDVSSAIESFEPEDPIQELADWICAGRPARSSGQVEGIFDLYASIKTEDGCPEIVHHHHQALCVEKVAKEEYEDDVGPFVRAFDLDDIIKGKRVKDEYDDDDSSSSGYPPKKLKREESSQAGNRRNVDKMVAPPPPFFLYGNVVNLSDESWNKMSQFLYGVEPEFASSEFFSAMSRKEGYLHNLPTEERHVVEPKSPMSIEEAMPHAKRWWPAWDQRRQLSRISTETVGVSQICESLRKMLAESGGVLSPEQQKKVLYHCRTLSLAWVGKYRLAPIEPEWLEKILGYPAHHTGGPETRAGERLEGLRTCFQTDTLAYHLSPLKCFFPDGLTLLSVYDGIGGAEVALHRLGIRLRGVVAVETSDSKRRILRRWWESSGQTGELVQIEDVQKLSSNKLEYLMNKFGGFDLVIGQNPCMYTAPMVKPGDVVGLDFSLYCEFVRVLQRIRSMMLRKSTH